MTTIEVSQTFVQHSLRTLLQDIPCLDIARAQFIAVVEEVLARMGQKL